MFPNADQPEPKFYLRHEYLATFRGKRPPDDHVGPFTDAQSAASHRATYGPHGSEIVELSTPPEPEYVMTPEQAAKYVSQRL